MPGWYVGRTRSEQTPGGGRLTLMQPCCAGPGLSVAKKKVSQPEDRDDLEKSIPLE